MRARALPAFLALLSIQETAKPRLDARALAPTASRPL
jgi:hypothetical protein